MCHSVKNLKKISAEFDLPGIFYTAEPYGTGHINDTYRSRRLADGTAIEYIHQRINHLVFKNPARLMDNILRVTKHLQNKIAARPNAEPQREALCVIPCRDGNPFYRDDQGNFWRTYLFITKARTFDICPGTHHARAAARAFGRFQADLADLPGERLHETIPYFHHTPRRFDALTAAIEQDTHNRAAGAKDAIDFCLAHKSITNVITDMISAGKIPERITHNDTKLNNVMIDDDTGDGICVIDLDTVMPGCVLYDFGDMVRSTTRVCDEDEPDPRRVKMDLTMYEALVQGYLESAGAFLSAAEIEYLVFSGQLITFTIGIRFLADYLAGDTYFKTHRPGQNLDRARVQFKMIENMERDRDEMEKIIRQYI